MQNSMYLAPAVGRLYSRKPIKVLAEELTLESEIAIGSDIILLWVPNTLIKSIVEELELILALLAMEPLSFKAEFENLLKKYFLIKS